jgi:hypothetical protein
MPDFPPPVEDVRALVDLGLTGWFVLTIIALMRRWVVTRATYDERMTEIERAWSLYERERADRIEAQREVGETVSVLKLGISVFDQLNQPPPERPTRRRGNQ